MFSVQVVLAFYYRNDEARTVVTLTWLAWVYLAMALAVFSINGRRLLAILRTAFLSPGSAALDTKAK
jgi:cation:H+ antiporter